MTTFPYLLLSKTDKKSSKQVIKKMNNNYLTLFLSKLPLNFNNNNNKMTQTNKFKEVQLDPDNQKKTSDKVNLEIKIIFLSHNTEAIILNRRNK